MKYIIGVDGGGTKTEAIAYSHGGEELGRGYSGFGNLLLNREKALENIIDSIRECMNAVEVSHSQAECIFVYLGLAGVESGDNRNKVERALKNVFNVSSRAVNDAEIALAALLKGEDGILTISGTGSISYGIKDGESKRAGGWGHLLGDEGSGYFIAVEAIKNMIEEEDSGFERSLLSKLIMDSLKIKIVDEIKGFVYSSQKGDIASLAPVVIKACEEGDLKALKILKQAGRDLAETTLKVHRRLGFGSGLKVGIKGSVLTHVKTVRNEFEARLRMEINCLEIIDEDISPAIGGYYLALMEPLKGGF